MSAPITTAADIVISVGQSLRIQNLGTNVLFVKEGTGATSSDFTYVLPACTVADDGLGGAYEIIGFSGTVSFAGTSVRYIANKR